ncbi:MAG: D-tyrosyl-tRNA(Tyr) deacylase [Chloroflexi bacterium]|jgi:D-tyrosyl-tRNA(Tyr) deacylase|nr:D-tyrosyl-tRNA(Tyr) deacylase [Chloroflexota bacterium]
MRVVLQRVTHARVTVDNQVVGEIDQGLLILIGVRNGDTAAEAKWLAEKIAVLRIFADEHNKFNRSLLDIGGGALVVPQFTLYGNVIGQRRPSFIEAAPPSLAAPLIDQFVAFLRQAGVQRVETGIFGAKMLVESANDGPVTLILEREAPRST